MNPQELLYWVRGTGLQIAAAVFVSGMSYRMLHLVLLGRKKSLATPRGSEWRSGLRTIWRRSLVMPELTARGRFTVTAGSLFHLGSASTSMYCAPYWASAGQLCRAA